MTVQIENVKLFKKAVRDKTVTRTLVKTKSRLT